MKKNNETKAIESIMLLSDEFVVNKLGELKGINSVLKYVRELPDSDSKKNVTNSIDMYDKRRQSKTRFQKVFINELIKHKNNVLVQCVLGEIFNELIPYGKNHFREEAARRGNPYSAFMLGKKLMEYGDVDRAIHFLEISIKNGFIEENCELAEYYNPLDNADGMRIYRHYGRKEVDLDLGKAKSILLVGAMLEIPKFQRKLGELYELENKHEEMLKWYTKAAENNDNTSQCYLGDYYHEKKDLRKAKHWHNKSANNKSNEYDRGNERLNRIYGNLADNSHEVVSDCGCLLFGINNLNFYNPKEISIFFIAEQNRLNGNYEKAIKYYKNIVDRSFYVAKRLSTIYELLGDYDEAIYWHKQIYNKSLQLDLMRESSRNIGRIYFDIYKDVDQGIQWYKNSADKKDFDSTMFLGDYYRSIKNYQESIHYYTKFTRNLTVEDLGTGCDQYNKDNQNSGLANEKLAALLFELGYDEIASYYYSNTIKGMKYYQERYCLDDV